MNEHSFIRSIHRLLPSSLYVWKINDNYAGGVADAYYSGKLADCWVEYKYVKRLPKREKTLIKIGTTAQQKLWLNARHKEGRKVFLVVGSPEGCLVLTGQELTLEVISRSAYIGRIIDKKEWVRTLLTYVSPPTRQASNEQSNNNSAPSGSSCEIKEYIR